MYNFIMFNRRIQRFISKIALFLVVFASLAPSVSHAMAAQNNGSFLQEICSVNGLKKVVIQTISTKGKQISAVFETKNTQQKVPASLTLHLEHCPFCGAAAANIAIAPAPAWSLLLQAQAKSVNQEYSTPFQSSVLQTAHPSRAPPAFI